MSDVSSAFGTVYTAGTLAANPYAASPSTQSYTADAFGNLIPTNPNGVTIDNQGDTINSSGQPTSTGVGNVAGTVANATGITTIAQFLSYITSAAFWQRFGIGVLGFIFIVIAIVMMGKKTSIQLVK